MIATCSKCGQKINIPDDKHIRFKCPNEACAQEYEYKNGKEFKPSWMQYLIPLSAIAIALAGSFLAYLFPIPLFVGVTWLSWWMSTSAGKAWIRTSSRLLLSTAIGFSLLLLLQITLNFIGNPQSETIPSWLLQLDDFLIWSRENLANISEVSLGVYILILATLLYITVRKPAWKPVSTFLTMEDWVGKVTAVLIVITSFTFFAPDVVEQSTEHAYYKHFKVVYRKKLTQERKRLIAEVLKKQIEKEDTSGYTLNLPTFYDDLASIKAAVADVAAEANRDAGSISAEYWNIYGSDLTQSEENGGNDGGGSGDGSDKNLERIWKEESIHWYKESGAQEEPVNNPAPKASNSPRSFVEATAEQARSATVLADESVEGLKAVCAKLAGRFIPGGEDLLGSYIEELINVATDQIFKISRVPDFVSSFFNTTRPQGKIDFFSRVGNFWRNIQNQRTAVLIKQRQEIELQRQAEQRVIQKALQQTEDLKANASNQLKDLITQKVNEISSTADVGVNTSEFKTRLLDDYKKQIDFDNLSEAKYRRLASSTTLNEEVLQTVLSTGASVEYHPFPRAGCPLCAYSRVRKLR
jgi:hypothetical protein